MMLTASQAFEQTLIDLIDRRIETLTENLSLGTSVIDYSGYTKQVGLLAGLREARALCDEANEIVSKR